MEEKQIALQIEDLQVCYGPIEAVRKVNLIVKEQSVVALLGANGAGKTSMLRTISGLTPASSGKIIYYGKDITNIAAEKIAKLGLAQAPEGRQIFTDLTVDENLKAGAYTVKDKKIIKKCYERCFRHFPRLQERRNQMANTLSGGELQMLAIARALMSNPKLLLLDEPSLGLAPLMVRDIFEIIKELREEGTTVLIVEQNAFQTLKIADYGYVLENGKVSIKGPSQELITDSNLVDAYLGGGK
ncbi:MAG: ABC transporter ATP-binding protein [Parasporobacterium sp.]|nr:ABC transporter ATP-binding protein [Parasporobacterium sp.]